MSFEDWKPASLEEKTSITQLDERTFSADLSSTYCIGTVPHGGYVASVFLKVAKAYLAPRGQPDTFVGHWQFLSRTQAGPAVLRVDEAKPGRSLSVLHITLHQTGLLAAHPWLSPEEAGRGEVAAYVTNRNMDDESGITLATGWGIPHAPPPVADLAALPLGKDPNWQHLYTWLMRRLPMMHNLEYYVPRSSHPTPATQDLWIRLAVGERFTNTAIGYVADAAAPLIPESYRAESRDGPVPPGRFERYTGLWYPTITMNLDIKKKLPAAGVEWLRLRVASRMIQDGRYDMELLVFDEQGDLVAIGHHVAMLVGMERNYANRGEVPRSKPRERI
ncbi:hypothetical protein TOPH_06693 [Tolypocladium ophioglossoides CBS 100239]|uniref:Thioesterase family protein n=1 Tax=Tolypocladium ophioglossoides (strain CBS 100239) TaxID=1163406 RepID=A0A0L0N3K6_TOLOC|nr:hypothetical protein TOPH_06693 [Tolypocladium ophioglossoides CBS 100239]